MSKQGDLVSVSQGASGDPLFIDTANNRVGVGTSSPTAKLEITGDAFTTWEAASTKFIGSKFSTTYDLGMYMDTDNRKLTLSAKAGDSTGTIAFQTGVTPTERMRINSSGHLLVGKTSTSNDVNTQGAFIAPTGKCVLTAPSGEQCIVLAKTGVSGSQTSAEFFYNGAVVGSISTTSAGTTYNTTSDRRLKENIEAIADGTEKLMAMRPVTHTWKNAPEAPAVHGFIAQEMIDIVPEAVTGDPTGEEMMSMDYGRITPVLVAALQDAHRKIAELESRLSAMEGN